MDRQAARYFGRTCWDREPHRLPGRLARWLREIELGDRTHCPMCGREFVLRRVDLEGPMGEHCGTKVVWVDGRSSKGRET